MNAMANMYRDDIETQYNPRKAVSNVEQYQRRAAELSAAARRAHKATCDVRYGAGKLATLDVFPAGRANAPLHVFLHGGYWRGRDKSDYSYVADALVPLGFTTVLMNYDLCPSASLPEIVAQVRQGLVWIQAHAAELGGDPQSVTLSGHSAGAHLIAAALAADTPAALLPQSLPKAAILVSGIYELEPVLSITVNDEIRLQPDQVDAMSPMRHPPAPSVPLSVVVGGNETDSWIAQSKSFAEACRKHGSACSYQTLDGHDHYSIMTLLETPESPLAKIISETAKRLS
jgi:arylformamidase